jgi:hypothetical protein
MVSARQARVCQQHFTELNGYHDCKARCVMVLLKRAHAWQSALRS